ncbi:aldo/keto reductase [Ramicandelaber brevisporus]|nr:aldo/keto reductase [Ramicandelaber brevisporus]KAI8868024.1 aldo/keto reductase [Ramicandelaber brevisporus]
MTRAFGVAKAIPFTRNLSPLPIGFGVWQLKPGAETYNAVAAALKTGYRLIDTASFYRNEADVGRAVRDSGIPREEIYVTTKLFDTDHGYEQTKQAFAESFEKLGLEYVDLYLIHSPNPGTQKRLASWKAMEELVDEGKVKAIGVSNYGIHHLEELAKVARYKPYANQIEVHPFITRKELVDYCKDHDIVVEAYCPLTRKEKLGDPTLKKIAAKYPGKTVAQLLLRWSVQSGLVPLPKSAHENRIVENANILDFEVSEEDMATMDALDDYAHICWDPVIAP